jgi:hypothetical protein
VTETPGLPDDWKQPVRVLQEKAWAALDPAKREHLAGLQRERDEAGMPRWEECLEYDPPLEGESEDAGWTLLMLRPANPRNQRPAELIGQWPTKFAHDELKNAQAIVAEHYLD